MSTLFATLLYNAPWLIAWYRVRHGKPIVGTLGMLFVMNFFMGWTIVGWILPLANALGYNPVPYIAVPLAKLMVQYGRVPGQGPAQGQGPANGSGPNTCSACGGSGSMSCSSCGARGSWYDAPQGEHGVAQLRTCNACMSSGRLRCTYCGGSGRLA